MRWLFAAVPDGGTLCIRCPVCDATVLDEEGAITRCPHALEMVVLRHADAGVWMRDLSPPLERIMTAGRSACLAIDPVFRSRDVTRILGEHFADHRYFGIEVVMERESGYAPGQVETVLVIIDLIGMPYPEEYGFIAITGYPDPG